MSCGRVLQHYLGTGCYCFYTIVTIQLQIFSDSDVYLAKQKRFLPSGAEKLICGP